MELMTQGDRYRLILDNARIGWWDANVTQEYFIGSDYLTNLLGVAYEKMSYAYVGGLIREDYRKRIISEFHTKGMSGCLGQIIPVQTYYGIKWVYSRVYQQSVNERGDIIVNGYIQVLPDHDSEGLILNEKAMLNELLGNLGSISHALNSFVQTNNPIQSVKNVLTEVLGSLNINGRAYIVEYFYEKNYQSRTYEVCSEGVDSVLSISQNISMNALRWFVDQIVASRPIFINSLKEIPADAVEEINLLRRQHVVSAIMIPMIAGEKVWGFLGLEIVDIPRMWSMVDYQWLSSVTNMISIVSEMSKTRDALDRSETLFRNIYTNIPVGIELYDKEGYLVDLNHRDMEIFGVPNKNDLLEKKFNVFEVPFIPEDILEKMRCLEPVSFRQNYYFEKVKEFYVTTRAGYLDVSTKIKMLYDNKGEFSNYLFINLDNTEKTVAYNRIEEFEKFFAAISDFAKVGYAKVDLVTYEGFASSQWYQNLGEKEGTPLSQIVDVYSHVHEEERQAMLNYLDAVRQGKAKGLRREFRIDNGEGGWRWIRTNVMKNTQIEDRIEVICINYDITELKEMQMLRKKAEELDRLKSAFLANMSHEIRTPLNAIVGFSTMLIDAETREEQVQYIEIIRNNNELLLQLISDILDLAKIESDTIKFNITEINLQDLYNEIIASMQIKVPENVRLCCFPGLPFYVFQSDRVRLIQVLSNFINNAIKHTSEGAITLSYQLYEEDIVFSVTDTGAGMSTEVQEQVFNRFYKADSFRQGTGLGLSICKSLVEGLGGKIGVKSEVGKGSYFWFSLPR